MIKHFNWENSSFTLKEILKEISGSRKHTCWYIYQFLFVLHMGKITEKKYATLGMFYYKYLYDLQYFNR